MLYRGVHATIGRTPLVELRRIGENGARLLAKLELRNPGGSVKDRIAAAMVEDAERRGVLAPGGTIVEATSGNTGIALAFVAATKGYTLHVTMPERMSKERLTLLRYLGAQVTLTPGALMGEAVEKAEALRSEIPGAVALDQFRNPANPEAHRETTGPRDLGGRRRRGGRLRGRRRDGRHHHRRRRGAQGAQARPSESWPSSRRARPFSRAAAPPTT